jgi:putative hydrolase of the HAD superfamily
VIFFDIDGTLLDDKYAVGRGLDVFHARYGAAIGMSRERLAGAWQESLDRHFARYLAGELSMQAQRRARMRAILGRDPAATLDDETLDEAFAVYLAGYERGWTCFAEVPDVLQQLSHLRLGVISNGDREQQNRKLEHTGLARFFDIVLTSSEIGVAKPDPRIFREACRRAGVSEVDAVYVGNDWSVDVVGSLAAGLQPIWLRRDGGAPRDLPPQVLVVQDLALLSEILV